MEMYLISLITMCIIFRNRLLTKLRFVGLNNSDNRWYCFCFQRMWSRGCWCNPWTIPLLLINVSRCIIKKRKRPC